MGVRHSHNHRRSRWCLEAAASVTLASSVLVLGGMGAGASTGATGAVVREPQYGFSFALPANWKQVPLDGSDVTALLDAAAHNDPTLVNALSSEVRSAATGRIKVFAVGPLTGSSVPNGNVVVTPSDGAPTGNSFAAAAAAEAKIGLTQIGASHIQAVIVTNPLGKVAEVTYELRLSTGPVFGDQFYALHNSNVEVVTVSSSNLASSRSSARLMVGSWRWSRS